MKVYVVTTGAYSDYSIEKIFTDRAKAEEYKEWLYDANDIEEYEIEDDIEISKFYRVHVRYVVYEHSDPKLEISVYKCIGDYMYGPRTYYADCGKYRWGEKHFVISMDRFVSAQNWNEEFYKNKYAKAVYDLAAIVKYKRAEGASETDIQALFSNMRGDLNE